MNATITYTLPAMQLVCHLVMPSNSNINDTDPAAIQPTSTIPVPRLPAGYVAYPDFGAAYKVYNTTVSWYIAFEKCAQDGARLAILDSTEKIQAVNNQGIPYGWGHVGFSQIASDDKWYNIYTGSSVPQSSLPWATGEPTGIGHRILIRNDGLAKYSCTVLANPVCQMTYP